MKSIANQYHDLKEGKMSQFNFMRNLRMSMPQFVTNTTSFNDAVRILKNKSILTEIYDGPSEPMGDGGLEDYYEIVGEELEALAMSKYNLDSTEIEQMFENEWHSGKNDMAIEKYYNDGDDPSVVAERILEDYMQMNEFYGDSEYEYEGDYRLGAYFEKVAEELEDLARKSNFDEAEIEQMFDKVWHSGIRDNFISKSYEDESDPGSVAADIMDYYNMMKDDELDDTIDRMEDEESGKYTKFQDFEGGLSEGKKKKAKKEEKPYNPNAIHPSELRMGIRVEMEHTDDPKKAEKIALDHLAENPYYYTALKLAGIDSPSMPKPKPVAPKKVKKKDATELVDKANQMQKVKLKEVLEKLIRAELRKY